MTNHNKKLLNAYATLATIFLFSHEESSADIIYTDVAPDETYFTNGDEYLLDVNNDGIIDFTINIINFSSAGVFSGFSEYYSALIQNIIVLPAAGNAIAGSITAGAYVLPYALNSDIIIGDGIEFQTGAFQTMVSYIGVIGYPEDGDIYPLYMYGNWFEVSDKFLGLRFINDDNTYYGWVRLSCPDNHTITIKDYAYDNDVEEPIITGDTITEPVPIAFETDSIIVSEGDGDVSITINAADFVTSSVTIALNTITSTASNGTDFIFTDPSPIVFSEIGPTAQSFTININDDIFDEVDETIFFDIVAVTPGCVIGTPSTVKIIVVDNDVPPPVETINFQNTTLSFNENEGAVAASINISNATNCTFDVVVNELFGSATLTLDYNFTSPETLSFIDGGLTSLNISIEILNDAAIEPDETFQLIIESPSSGYCAVGESDTLLINIVNDDFIDIHNQTEESIEVYSSGQMLYVNLPSIIFNSAQLTIVDNNNKIVFIKNIVSYIQEINLSSLPLGIYYLQLDIDGVKFNKQFMIF